MRKWISEWDNVARINPIFPLKRFFKFLQIELLLTVRTDRQNIL
jgi:hypothetical protein